MREIRYRFVQRSRMAEPYGAWFADARGAILHGTGFRFDPDATSCTMVGFARHVEPLAHALREHPAPAATRWDVKVGDLDMVHVDARWREPPHGRVPSPPRVAWDVFGDAARCSFSMRRGAVTHRILLPDDAPTEALWGRLVKSMNDYAALAGVDIRCELERVATRILEPDPSDAEYLPAILSAFDLGALDRPAASTPGQVARFLGLTEACVETYLQEARAMEEGNGA